MTTALHFADFLHHLARRGLDPARADRLALHLFDTLGALAAGRTVADAKAIATLAPGAGPTAPPPAWIGAATIRCTEIDDIHLSACVTPSAAIVPVLLECTAGMPDLGGPCLLQAYLSGLEAMLRFAHAAGGPRLMQRGIWPSRLAAPIGAAAAASVLLSSDAERTAHALAIAAAMAAGLSPRGAVPSSRWLVFGRAVDDGVMAARAAAAGLRGDPTLLDEGWAKSTGIPLDPGGLDAGPGDALLTAGLGLKPWCAARQTMAAVTGFMELLRRHDLDAAALARVEVAVPPAYASMIDHDDLPTTRPASFANLRYLLGLAAFAPEGLLDVGREDLRIDARLDSLARRTHIEGSDALSARYPECWPARVSVETARGAHHSIEITEMPGDATNPFTWDRVEAKIARATRLGADHVSPLANACRTLPQADSAADLIAALAACCAAVDAGGGGP
ncbi:MAG: MmgE/PrpD family protein [Alphaproteobacteria bacterium]|nr:MmgE/PrpD family protein [Alphaproteobacteria bacterium]